MVMGMLVGNASSGRGDGLLCDMWERLVGRFENYLMNILKMKVVDG